MPSKADDRKARLLAALRANPDGVTFFNLCVVCSMPDADGYGALDELTQTGQVEFVEPDLWRLKTEAER